VALFIEERSKIKLRSEITDRGCGISPEGLKGIFTPFERLGADLSEVSGSPGLEVLALSRRLWSTMGGTIGAKGSGPGDQILCRFRAVEDPSLD